MVSCRSVVVAVALTCHALPAAADDAGLDWRPIAAADSKLRISLDGAKDQAQYFRAQTANYSANLFVARVPTRDYPGDQVTVVYVELLPG